MHQTGGDLKEVMHVLVGKWAIGAAIARIGCIFSDKIPMIYGFLVVMVGMVFNFSNPQFTKYWVLVLEYHGMALCVIVMLMAFYIASITATVKQLVDVKKTDSSGKSECFLRQMDKEVEYEMCPLVEDAV